MRLVRALALLSALAGLGLAAVAAPAAAPAAEAGRVRHSMKVTLDPARGWLSVTDVLSRSGGFLGTGRIEVPRNRQLEPRMTDSCCTPG